MFMKGIWTLENGRPPFVFDVWKICILRFRQKKVMCQGATINGLFHGTWICNSRGLFVSVPGGP